MIHFSAWMQQSFLGTTLEFLFLSNKMNPHFVFRNGFLGQTNGDAEKPLVVLHVGNEGFLKWWYP